MILVSAVRWRAERVMIEPRVGAYVVTVCGVVGAGLSTRLDSTIGQRVAARVQKLTREGKLDVLTRSGRASFTVTVERTAIGPRVSLTRKAGELPGEAVGSALGDYQLTAVLRHEDDCIVYRAVHRAFGRTFALKVPQCTRTSIEEANVAIIREARALAKVEASGVIRAAGVAPIADGRVALVLELASNEAESLSSILRREGPIPAARATTIGSRIAAALQACHEAGVTHRGLGMESVLVDADDRIQIVAFGSARSCDDAKKTSDREVVRDVRAARSLVDQLIGKPILPDASGTATTAAALVLQLTDKRAAEQPAWRRWLAL